MRVRIMWTAVIICMVIIFLLWLVSLQYSLKKASENTENSIIPEQIKESILETKKQLSPVNEMNAGINSLFEENKQEKSPFEVQ